MLRYRGRYHHIGIRRPYAGWRVYPLVAGTDVQILDTEGELIRRLPLDPSVDYQAMP